MPLATLLSRGCTVTRVYSTGAVNDSGDEIIETYDVDTVCELQQRQRSEDSDPGQLSKTSWLLVLPAATEIGTADKVTIEDLTYEVVGEPWVARNPRTGLDSHIEATLVRTSAAGETVAS